MVVWAKVEMAVRQYKEIRLYVLKLVDTRQQRSGGTRTNSEMGRRPEAAAVAAEPAEHSHDVEVPKFKTGGVPIATRVDSRKVQTKLWALSDESEP